MKNLKLLSYLLILFFLTSVKTLAAEEKTSCHPGAVLLLDINYANNHLQVHSADSVIIVYPDHSIDRKLMRKDPDNPEYITISYHKPVFSKERIDIYCPDYMILDIRQSYGSLVTERFKNKYFIELKRCEFHIGDLLYKGPGVKKLNISFSEGNLSTLECDEFLTQNSVIKLKKIKAKNYQSVNTEIYGEYAEFGDLNGIGDQYIFDSLSTENGNAIYSRFDIQNIPGKVDLSLKFSDFHACLDASPNAEIHLKTRSSDTRFDISDPTSWNFDMLMKNTEFKAPSSMENMLSIVGEKVIYKQNKNTPPKKTIIINAEGGSLRIEESCSQ